MIPTDLQLYNAIKDKLYLRMPKHSAYRSGLLVQNYKKAFQQLYPRHSFPYKGKKQKRKGLSRWFSEKWRNQRGTIGYQHKNDVYRPTRRITRQTPTTFSELSPNEIKRARREKYTTRRVRRFKTKK